MPLLKPLPNDHIWSTNGKLQCDMSYLFCNCWTWTVFSSMLASCWLVCVSLPLDPEQLCGPPNVLSNLFLWAFSLGLKWVEHEVHHSPLHVVLRFRMCGTFTSTLPYIFMVWKYRCYQIANFECFQSKHRTKASVYGILGYQSINQSINQFIQLRSISLGLCPLNSWILGYDAM
jgi:hypothetical protein